MNGSSGSGGFLAILLLVGFVAVMLVWRWLARKASSGINRAIHQGQHEAGQAAAGTQHFLKAGSLSPQGVLDAIYLGLPYEQAREGSGVLNASIFKDGGTGVPRLRIGFGKKFTTFWSIVMVPVDGGVAYTVEEATMSNGLVVGTKELVDAQALVLRIAKSADPQLAVQTRTDQVKWK